MKSEITGKERACFIRPNHPAHVERKKKCHYCGKDIYHRLFCLECQEMFKEMLQKMSFSEMLAKEKEKARRQTGPQWPHTIPEE